MKDIFYTEIRNKIREITDFLEDAEMLMAAADKILELLHIARKEGLLALEDALDSLGEDDFWHYFREMITFIVDGSDKEVMEDIFFSRYFTLDLKGAEGLVYLIFLRGTFAIQAGENEYVVTKRLQSLLPVEVLQIYEPKLWNVERTHEEKVKELCQREPAVDRDNDNYFFYHMADYTFASLTDADMKRILKDVSDCDVSTALKGMDGKAAKKALDNLSLGRQKMVVEDMEYMGPVRSMDVVASEQKILNILVNLINDGEIDGNNYSHLSAFM
ncbi:MAG: FliG C-terminal domain-containing protein [Roseburia sp. 1XD42-69]